MRLKTCIDNVMAIRPSDYPVTAMVNWINSVEGEIKNKILKEFVADSVDVVANQAAYDLPVELKFRNIRKVFLNGRELSKLDMRSYQNTGFYENSNGQIELYPAPTGASVAGLRIVSQKEHTAYTLDNYNNDDVELMAPEPFSELYEQYLFGKIHYMDKQYDDFNNDTLMYNNTLEQYAAWVNVNGPKTNLKSINII